MLIAALVLIAPLIPLSGCNGCQWPPGTGDPNAPVDPNQGQADPNQAGDPNAPVNPNQGQADPNQAAPSFDPLVVDAGPDVETDAGVPVQLAASVTGGDLHYSFQWSPADGLDDPTLLQPHAAPLATTTYTLTVADSRGVTAHDQVTVSIAAPPVIPSTANSITTALGGARNDPEGVAPPAASVTRLTWKDARGADRTLVLGAYLYQYDFSFTDNVAVIARSANDDAYGHPGFGYVVSHNSLTGNSPFGKQNAPTAVTTTVFAGGHHAIHRVELIYDRDKEGGGNGIQIPVIIEWLVATGRDHPVWAVTWRVGQATNPIPTDFNVYRMDTRGPYGSLNFDGAATGAAGDAIGGVAWGDFGLKFIGTDVGMGLTLVSPWTYNTPNTVCFTQAWTKNTNAEMGIVQTRLADKQMGYPDRVVGRERGNASGDAFLDKGDCAAFADPRMYAMPCIAGWPYQLMNYDWDPGSGKPTNQETSTKLIAWGSPYGWLGASDCALFDNSGVVDGRGDRAYATLIVLGPKARHNPVGGALDQPGDVALAIAAVQAFNAATITNVNPGSLVLQVPKGPGASETKAIANGYNDTYAAYYLSAASNQVTFRFTPGAGQPVTNPIFVVQGYTADGLPQISVDGAVIGVNTGAASSSGAFVSVNTDTNELWVTLNETLNAATDVQIMP